MSYYVYEEALQLASPKSTIEVLKLTPTPLDIGLPPLQEGSQFDTLESNVDVQSMTCL